MRIGKACLQCRISKKKCIDDDLQPQGSCLACQQRHVQCSKALRRRTTQSPLPVLVSDAADGHGCAEQPSETVLEFVGLYLQFIHERPHTLFHKQTLWHEIRSGVADECLWSALCALGCRFSSRDDRHALADMYKSRSSAAFMRHLEQISLSHIQTCILLANLYAAEKDHRLEALYFGIANRMSYVLGLHRKQDGDSPVLQEVKCRVLWSLYMADKWCPPGLDFPRELSNPGAYLDLPMDELSFQNMDMRATSTLPVRQAGFWGQYVLLVEVFGSIQDLNLSLVRDDRRQALIDAEVMDLAQRLHVWFESLPGHMTMNESNLEIARQQGLGGSLVALHLGFHHYSTLLYFQYLDSISSSSIKTVLFAERCRSHALAFSRLLRRARECGDCHVVYLTVAHMTMVSSSVLLHMLLSGNDEENRLARTELLSNFQSLLELKKYWPRMDLITERLLIFQGACMKSSAGETHAVDKWMIRFLLEYGLPLEKSNKERSSDVLLDAVTPKSPAPLQQQNSLGQAFEELCA